ncbi:CMP-N-acetylneuraminate-beta-galactosamide-alpha-2,3-sialyltransferase 4-like isoform X2 [Pseudophryne corroboree]
MKHIARSTMRRAREKWKVLSIFITMNLCFGTIYLLYIREEHYVSRNKFDDLKKITPPPRSPGDDPVDSHSKLTETFVTLPLVRTKFHVTKKITPKENIPERVTERIRKDCTPGDVPSRANGFIYKYSRDHPAFLQSGEVFWRSYRSFHPLPYGTRGSETLIKRALTVLSQCHIPKEIERLQCRRCVVVGNGYQMANSGLGEKIDEHDVVIRLNNAPVHEYQKDVGNKTTFRLFYPESAHFDQKLDNNPDTLNVLVPFKTADILWIQNLLKNESMIKNSFWKAPPLNWEVQPENVRIFNPYFVEVAARDILGYNRRIRRISVVPTTGLIAITFAIHFCDQVNIAGFGYPTWNWRTQPIHYYNNETMSNMFVASQHNIPLEHRMLTTLLQHRIIQSLTAT